jgi:hypothetical protein
MDHPRFATDRPLAVVGAVLTSNRTIGSHTFVKAVVDMVPHTRGLEP